MTVLLGCIFFSVLNLSASFNPMSLASKSRKADLIIKGTVVSISPKSLQGGKRQYAHARSMATVRIDQVWKIRKKSGFLFRKNADKQIVPKFIEIPCDYPYRESPSDLTVGKTYVMFLEKVGAKFFHPLDPASMHVVFDGRVSNFGVNHAPDEKFGSRSIPIAEFRNGVRATEKII